MNEIKKKKATKADEELIAELSRKTFNDAFAADNTKANMDKFMNETFTSEKLIKEVGSPGNTFLLAWDGDEAVGYARLRETPNPLLEGGAALEIARIYAVQKSIGKGVGRALMQRSIETARK